MKKNYLLGIVFSLLFFQFAMAQPNGRRVDVGTLSALQQSALAAAMHGYITQDIIEEHACNTEYLNASHPSFYSWSIHGPEMFLNWHREYLAEMEEAIQPTLNSMGLTLLPRWDVDDGMAIIDSFANTDPSCFAITCYGGTNSNPSGYPNGYNTTFPAVYTPSPNLTCSNWSSYENFSTTLSGGYHGIGHLAPGGVMGNFKSPALPMFWLWHGMIDDIYWDYQQDCMANAELHMKDNTSDTGAEPSSGTLYLSHDIWVRLYQDTPTGPTATSPGLLRHPYGSTSYANEGAHQNPYHSPTSPNYVYVRIRNSSTEDFSGGRLRVYWSKASTGLNWPTTWDNYYAGTAFLHGDEILPSIPGQIPTEANLVIPPIPSGGQFIMEVPWHTVPNPTNFTTDVHHFCLLARIVSSHDDMTVTEGPTLWSNVANNNNIAWKNVQIYYDPSVFMIVNDGGGEDPKLINEMVKFMGVYVTNPYPEEKFTRLRFEALAEEGQPNFFDIGGAIFARMDQKLFEKWKDGGMQGEKVTFLGEYNERYYVRIESPDALMDNMILDPYANHDLELGFCLDRPAATEQQFDFDVKQFDKDGIVGGERYEIMTKRNVQEGMVSSFDENGQGETSLHIYPNPASSSFTVSYNLTSKNDVEVLLYDLNGKIVAHRNAISQNVGQHNQAFDISNLSKGIYFIKVQMGEQIISKKVIVN